MGNGSGKVCNVKERGWTGSLENWVLFKALPTSELGMYNLGEATFLFSCLGFSAEEKTLDVIMHRFQIVQGSHWIGPMGSVKGLLTFHILSHHILTSLF